MGFREDVIYLDKESSINNIITKMFSRKEISLQNSVLKYDIDIYFPKYNLAIEIGEFGCMDRITSYEIDRENKIKDELGCKFIRINPDKEKFDIFFELGKIYHYIVESIKKKIDRDLLHFT